MVVDLEDHVGAVVEPGERGAVGCADVDDRLVDHVVDGEQVLAPVDDEGHPSHGGAVEQLEALRLVESGGTVGEEGVHPVRVAAVT